MYLSKEGASAGIPVFLKHDSELAGLIRAFGWKVTSLGAPDAWPQPLKTLVGVMLASNQPMFIVWGEERILLYNDAYSEILGNKHPAALGQGFLEVWHEIQGDLAPPVEEAYAGRPVQMNDIELFMVRNGHTEETHFSFSYTPIRDEAETIAGFLCACTETTSQVLAERRRVFLSELERQLRDRATPHDVVACAQEALGRHLKASRVGYGNVDETERYFTTDANWTDGTVPSRHGTHDLAAFGPEIWGALKRGERLLVRDVRQDRRTSSAEAVAAFDAIDTGAVITATLVKDERLRVALYVHHRDPQLWTEDDAALVEEVAERTWAAAERARAEAQLRLERDRSRNVLDGMGEGYVLLDRSFRVVDINAEGMRLEARSREEIIGKTHWAVWPGSEHSEIGQLYKRVMSDRVPGTLEHRYIWPDEREAWIEARAYPVDLGLAVFYRDVTARALAGQRMKRRSDQLQELSKTALAVARAQTVSETLNEITQAARHIIGAHQAVVSLSQNSDWSQTINNVDLSDKYADWRGYAALTDGTGIYACVCETNQPMRMTQDELEAHPRWRGFGTDATEHPPMRGWLAVPLIGRNGQNLGLIQLSDKDEGEFDEADEAMLIQLAQLASAAVEQTEAEAALRASENRMRTLADTVPAFVWFATADGAIHYLNRRWYEYTGQTSEQAMQNGWANALHPDDMERTARIWTDSLASGANYAIELRYRRHDGEYRWYIARAEPVRDEAGAITAWFGTSTDIHDHKLAEAALRSSEARLQLAQRGARAAAWEWDLTERTIRWADPALIRELAGEDVPETVSEEEWLRYIHPEDAERRRTIHTQAVADGAGRTAYRVIRNGELRWLETVGEVTARDAAGLPLKFSGITLDVTAQRRAEELLRESETRLRLAIDAAHMSIWESDTLSGKVTGTPRLNQMLGFAEGEELTVEKIRARYYPGEQERLQKAGEEALCHPERFGELEFRYCLPDGAPRWMLLRAQAQIDGAGKHTGFVGVLMDITERKRAEEHQRLLIDELNHRVKNSLAIVQGLAMQTFRGAAAMPSARAAFEGRLEALSAAHNILTRENWEAASLGEVVATATAPFQSDSKRVTADGPELRLSPKMAVNLTLALHELGTNALKHGALSVPSGRVEVSWWIEGDRLKLVWREHDGPAAKPPETRGFGTRMIERGLAAELGGEVKIDFRPEGVVCSIDAPLPEVDL